MAKDAQHYHRQILAVFRDHGRGGGVTIGGLSAEGHRELLALVGEMLYQGRPKPSLAEVMEESARWPAAGRISPGRDQPHPPSPSPRA